MLRLRGKSKWDASTKACSQAGGTILCNVCRKQVFNQRWRKPGQQQVFGDYCYRNRPFLSLRNAAIQECRICRLVWENLPAKHKEPGKEEPGALLTCCLKWIPDNSYFYLLVFTLRLGLHPGAVVPRSFDLDFDTVTITEKCTTIRFTLLRSDSPITPRPAASAISLPACLVQINEWLSKCSAAHTPCQYSESKLGKSNLLPTRLVDVGCEALGLDPCLTITAETTSGVEKTKYLTLSHRWDTERTVRLTVENQNSLKQSIKEDTLSQTFRDAFSLTRALGLRYIWIDSLCIIQNSVDDWITESARMGEVYKRSYLTIAAMAGAEGHDGLFTKNREPLLIAPIPIYIRWRHHCRFYYCIKGDLWQSGVEQAVLNRRGWVLQERYMSPRTIYFGAEQLYWECRGLMACETWPEGIREMVLPCKTWFDNLKGIENPYTWWRLTVEDYSKCSLTREEDKLVALSGIAKEMQHFSGDKYLAGLWRNNLVEDMLWAGSTSRPTRYRAPSWSWASVEGQIRFRNARGRVHEVEILDAHTDHRAGDPTGQVFGGYIRLAGKLKVVYTESFRALIDSPLYRPAPDYSADEKSRIYDRNQIWVLPVTYQKDYERSGRTLDPDLICLVLESTGTEPGQFKRLGLLEFNNIMSKDELEQAARKYTTATSPAGKFHSEYTETQIITII